MIRITPDSTGAFALIPEDLIEELYRQLERYEPKSHWSSASKSLVMRLRGLYAIGPQADQGIGEFGIRDFGPVAPIQAEAAARIEELEEELQQYRIQKFTKECEKRGI